MDFFAEKQKLREKLIAARAQVFPRQRLEFSNKICEKLIELAEVQYADNILSYSAIGAEVDLSSFDKWAGEHGKKIFFPEKCTETNISAAFVPGVSFDLECNRLGRGKGFYDRLLPQLNCAKIGIAFDLQIVGKVPVEQHDATVDVIVTEKRLIRP